MTLKDPLAPVWNALKIRFLRGFLSLMAFPSAASGAITTFGSDNDSYGGFTTGVSTIVATPAPAWSLTATGARFANDTSTDSGQVNSSLLKEYTLNRTSGTSYTVAGVLDTLSTYAADNNRFGISLFGNTVDLSGIDTGLSLQHNVGNGNFLILGGGIVGSTLASANYGGLNLANAIGTTFTYQAAIAFVGTDIEIDFTLIDGNNFSQTISATVAAANYTGTHFGFGTRGRVRKTDTRIAPFIYAAKSFDVTMVPEPSTVILLAGGAFGWLMFRRRPVSNRFPMTPC